jgi:MFS transporter, Spinster family, sphingosine-1-phosphate transporter
MLATSILFFVISGIQFWASDYMRLVLKIPEEIVFPAFSIITLTGPTLGCIIGGGLTHMFGGYNHPNTIKLILYVGFVGTVISLPIPFVDHTPTFLTLFWLSLFSGGFIMPGITGVMINAAPRKHKALANSIAYVSYNLLGYVPGPLLYGVLTVINGPESKIGMFVLIYSLIL